MGPLLTGKIAKIGIYDKGRVNGGTNYDSPVPRGVPKLFYIKKHFLDPVFKKLFGDFS